MSFSPDYLLDRARLKRRVRFWQGFGVLALILTLIILGSRFTDSDQGPFIARLSIEGVIRDDPLRDQVIRELGQDDDVKAVIVRINSPGGTAVGGEALYQSLLKLAEQKPVVSVMGELATSAGYMTAIATPHIIARESTITGSIGVIMQSMNIEQLLDTLGITPVTIKSGPLKATPNPVEPLTPEIRASTQALIDDMFDMFISMVAQQRELPLETVRPLADGRVFTGRQALSNGLIDAIGGEAQAKDWLQTTHDVAKDLEVLEINYAEENFWSSLNKAMSGDFLKNKLFSQGLGLDGLLSVWHPQS